MSFSLVDGIILVVLFYFFFRGWRRGFLYLFSGFVAFVSAFILAIKFADPVSQILSKWFGLPAIWNIFIAFFSLAFVIEAILSTVLSILLTRAPVTLRQSTLNRVFGAIFSAGSGVLILAAFLLLVLLVPVRGTIKESVNESTIAPYVLSILDTYGGPLPRVLNESARKITQFITISPSSTERLSLPISVEEKRLRVDFESEAEMLHLVNQERQMAGAAPLVLSLSMQNVARSYSKNMLLEKYFAHVDAQGKDAADRLTEGGVRFLIAGENLAYAPSITIAHDGLMNSAGHKRNILDPEFKRIGIGVIDAGVWGKMFTQVFAD